jgi:hypothetical protein
VALLAVEQPALHRSPDRLHHRVVDRAGHPAHRAEQPGLTEPVTKDPGHPAQPLSECRIVPGSGCRLQRAICRASTTGSERLRTGVRESGSGTPQVRNRGHDGAPPTPVQRSEAGTILTPASTGPHSPAQEQTTARRLAQGGLAILTGSVRIVTPADVQAIN